MLTLSSGIKYTYNNIIEVNIYLIEMYKITLEC